MERRSFGAGYARPVSGVDAWRAPAFGDVGVFHNGAAVAVSYITAAGDNAIYQPGELGMHPGPNAQYGVVQFTAPTNGLYKIHGTFEGIDITGATTDVHLLWNNFVVASDSVIGFGPVSDKTLSFGPVLLNAGDTLAYAVGGDPIFGSTGLLPGASVDAAAVPEPSTFFVAGLGAIGLVGYLLRRAG